MLKNNDFTDGTFLYALLDNRVERVVVFHKDNRCFVRDRFKSIYEVNYLKDLLYETEEEAVLKKEV